MDMDPQSGLLARNVTGKIPFDYTDSWTEEEKKSLPFARLLFMTLLVACKCTDSETIRSLCEKYPEQVRKYATMTMDDFETWSKEQWPNG
jgi:hypothetical protein